MREEHNCRVAVDRRVFGGASCRVYGDLRSNSLYRTKRDIHIHPHSIDAGSHQTLEVCSVGTLSTLGRCTGTAPGGDHTAVSHSEIGLPQISGAKVADSRYPMQTFDLPL